MRDICDKHHEEQPADTPWLKSYPDNLRSTITQEFDSVLAALAHNVGNHPQDIAIQYFDGSITWHDLDRMSDALAAALVENGIKAQDRVALYTQNNPGYVIGLLATWKAGGIAVAMNPMLKEREVTGLLKDSGATALICLDSLWHDVAKAVIGSHETSIDTVITLRGIDFQTESDPRVFQNEIYPPIENTLDLLDTINKYRGQEVDRPQPVSDDIAMLTYTSGTTGDPKGSVSTHGNISFNAQTYRDWIDLGHSDVILGIAPLFHVTGLVGHIGVSILSGAKLVLLHRFQQEITAEAIRKHHPTFTVGSITVFIALTELKSTQKKDWSSFKAIYSGGAPVAPAVAADFKRKTGKMIHNIYGLTETNSPSHGVPLHTDAPVDNKTGALSVGLPVFNTFSTIVDEDGRALGPNEIGEIVVSGPQVTPGYWNKPHETRKAIVNGKFYTGDVGFMDEAGWFYLVDRKKDMINASGYKVWPREVEDVLYEHESVLEAAVVGVPDSYRGETVKAFVSVRANATATEAELIEHCKARLAAYKYPRSVEILPELPKTATGKLLRRQLRDTAKDSA